MIKEPNTNSHKSKNRTGNIENIHFFERCLKSQNLEEGARNEQKIEDGQGSESIYVCTCLPKPMECTSLTKNFEF